MSSWGRQLALAGVGALMALATGAVEVGSAVDEPLAKLAEVRPDVGVKPAAALAELIGTEGRRLNERDAVSTGTWGRATVRYFDGSMTRVARSTRLIVESLQSRPTGRSIVLRLDVGRTWHRVQSATASNSRFEIKTSSGTVAVRGTSLAVQCATSDRCQVDVVKGSVEVIPVIGAPIHIRAGGRVGLVGRRVVRNPAPLQGSGQWLDLNEDLDELDDDLDDGDEFDEFDEFDGEAEFDPDAPPEGEPDPDAEFDPDAPPEGEPDPDADPDPDAAPDPDPGTDPDAEPDPDAGSEPDPADESPPPSPDDEPPPEPDPPPDEPDPPPDEPDPPPDEP